MKTVCSKHERAYEVGEGCPWCEPEPKLASELRRLQWDVLAPPGRGARGQMEDYYRQIAQLIQEQNALDAKAKP